MSEKRYSLVVPSSMGVRLTPLDSQPFHCSERFEMQATSAETNVACVVSSLGLPVKVLTAFVKESPVAQFIKHSLRSRGMEMEGPEFEQEHPWGLRHQINMADSGWGARGPRVQNDRAGEVGRELTAADFDLERIFCEEGVDVVHLSGLIAALSSKTSAFCLEVARVAQENGSKVSFDLNYRASFWKGREEELSATFAEIASRADILMGNEEDFQLCLGMEGPEEGGTGLEEKIEAFKEMIERVQVAYPNASWFGTTLREVQSANRHLWGALVSHAGAWEIIKPREIGVLDRIGGGDGFVGGLLYGILKGWSVDKCTQFGWASGALAATMLTDYVQPVDEEQLWNIWEGNARVKR